jgi:hypothetical protein
MCAPWGSYLRGFRTILRQVSPFAEKAYVLTALLLLPGIKADVARCLKRPGGLLDFELQAGVPVTCHGGSPPHSSVSFYLRPRQGTAHP